MQQPTFTTDRLNIRPAQADDLSELHALWSDRQVRRYLFDDQPVTPDLAQAVLDDCLSRGPAGLGLWVVEDRATSALLGCVGLNPATTAASFEPALAGLVEPLAAFMPASWHKGYAHESLSRLLAYAFGPLSQQQLAAVNDAPNLASEKMLLRLGFAPHSEVQGPRYRLRTYLLSQADWNNAGASCY